MFFDPHFYVLHSWSSTSLRCWGLCWAAPHRPASPTLAQLQDKRNSLELITETSVISWMGKFTHLKQGPWAAYGRWDVAASSLLGGRRGNYQLLGNWSQVGSIVSRETSRGELHLPLRWEQSPSMTWGMHTEMSVRCVWYKWSKHWPGRGWTENKRATSLSGLNI